MEPTEEDIVRMTNEALADFGTSVRRLETIHIRMNELIQLIQDWHQSEIEELEAKIKEDRETFQFFWENYGSVLRDSKGGKTATLRNGIISERLHPVSLRIGDAKGLLKYLGVHGVLRRFTHQPPRVINKDALKRDRKFLQKIPKHLVQEVQERTLHILPTDLQVKSKRGSANLTIPLDDKKEG